MDEAGALTIVEVLHVTVLVCADARLSMHPLQQSAVVLFSLALLGPRLRLYTNPTSTMPRVSSNNVDAALWPSAQGALAAGLTNSEAAPGALSGQAQN